MEPNSIIQLPHVDKNGYFDHMTSCMVDADGAVMIGSNCYEIDPPADDGKHFYKLSATKDSWVAEKIPTTPEEFVGIVLNHQDQTDRVHRLRKTLEELTSANADKWQIHQDIETNDRSIEAIPEQTLEELRAEKLEELDSAFKAWYEDGATLVSSLGFEADSDSRAMQDVNGLVTAAESSEAVAKAGIVFMDANNAPHRLDLAQLKVLQIEIIQAASAAYEEKWAMRTSIEGADTKEAIEAVDITFHPADFSGANE